MNHPGPIKLSKRAKDQLAQLTRHTGIEHRNVLCRWALAERPRRQLPKQSADDVALTIDWRTVSGDGSTALLALLTQRHAQESAAPEALASATIELGLSSLTPIRSVAELVARAVGR